MKSMRQVWILTVAVTAGALLAWAIFWASSGRDVRSGALGDTMLGFWVVFTQEGTMMWLPYLLFGLGAGFITFMIARSSFKNREAREAHQQVLAQQPHPMD
ncbi:MAG: hypothetical protein RL134_625 [Actinomycetota bacterium]